MKNTIYIFLFLFAFACGSDTDSGSAATINETQWEALQAQATEMELDVKQLQQTSNQIQIQGRGLTPEEISLTEAIDELVEAYTNWKTSWEGKTITKEDRQEWKTGFDQLTEQVDEVLDLAAQ